MPCGKYDIIGPDAGQVSLRKQAITWTGYDHQKTSTLHGMPSELSETNINDYVSIYPIEYVTISFHLMNSILYISGNETPLSWVNNTDSTATALEMQINRVKLIGPCEMWQ